MVRSRLGISSAQWKRLLDKSTSEKTETAFVPINPPLEPNISPSELQVVLTLPNGIHMRIQNLTESQVINLTQKWLA